MPLLQTTTYSAAATTGAFDHPLAGAFALAGINQGARQYVVAMETARTTKDTSSDGAVMINYMPGQSGTLSIECQQTSLLDQFLLTWANLVFSAADAGDVTDVASAVILLRNNSRQHTLTGVSPTKIPDQQYGAAGAYRNWVLNAANIVTV
jgi:hypothetical protein